MLAGRAGEIVSRRETPSQCGRVGSPVKNITYCLSTHVDIAFGKTSITLTSCKQSNPQMTSGRNTYRKSHISMTGVSGAILILSCISRVVRVRQL